MCFVTSDCIAKTKSSEYLTRLNDWDASEEDLKQFDEQGIKVVVVDKPENEE